MSHASSSSKICKYDVFLSFRGKDTRKTFVSHLYNALQQRGIHAFKDDERLERGKSISDELLKAIEEARFAVVIFSKSYASSRWCLEELAHIIKCKNELEQIVIPVFHDVNPSDVRHQNSPFAKSFSKHEKKYKDDMEKVQRWRDAFADAGKLSGYHLINCKDEADCIKKLVDDIFPKSLQVISPFPESLVGMQSQVEKVTSLLDMESNDVRSIGIWGMGGIGKTEIASVLYQRYRHRFEADCFLGNVGTLYQKNGLTWLAEVVICKLLGEKMTLTSEHEGVIILKNRLRWKKVLFILDDVNHREQLEFLVGGQEWFGRGSRIILTARDKHLLISHVGDNVYEVQLLSKDEALELFSKHAFGEKSPKEDFMELSRQVVKHAGGLPLALKVLGSSFYGRDKKHWRHIIDRLKRIPDNDILGKLRLSFDGLDKDDKVLFLDFAFLDFAFLDIAWCTRYTFNRYMELALESRGFQLLRVDYLIEKSLLSIGRSHRIVMHNMIRDMAVNVIQEEYSNSRIWLPEEIRDLFKGKLIAEKVESLWIPKNYDFEDNPVNYSNIFRRMRSLQVLVIGDGSSDSAITYLPSSLRFIEWQGYPSISLPESFEPSQLVVLHLHKSWLVELWPISKKLINLKHLDLSKSLGLTKTPNFGDMPNLERLNLERCSNLEEVHPSLGHCRMLTFLSLHGCVKLRKLPKFVTMESLETLYLDQCTSLEEFPEICGDMWRLSVLEVGSPWIRRLHPSLSGLRRLELRGCEVLESIPDTIQNLDTLNISGCNELATLPNSIFESQQLENLEISYCSRLVELPISLGHCRMLTNLSLRGCLKLKKLPKFVCMESLETLNLDQCTSLEEFPEICGDMWCLSRLEVGSPWIRSLPPSLWGLNYLELSGCEVFESIPDTIQNLEYLSISGCNKLATLPNSIFESQQLEYLHIDQCSGLVELPKSLGVHKKLGLLKIDRCENLKKLPRSIHMESLQQLNISNCPKLDTFPKISRDMHWLGKLAMESTGVRELPSSIGSLSGLTELNLRGCEDLVSLPNSLCNLKNLQQLFLCKCKKLVKLPENIGDLQELETLDASETAICQPPPSITKLVKLKELRLSLERQFQHPSSFVLHQVSGLSSLIELDLCNHNILGGLLEDLGSLTSLRHLNVSGSSISCSPKSINVLPGEPLASLKSLDADYRLPLESIRDLVIKCLKLDMLSISECETVSSEQVKMFLQHFVRTCIQCDFHQRDSFRIYFSEVRIPELFDYQFVNQKEISIDLNPSWYTKKFMGFSICCCPNSDHLGVEATLVCKSDPERKHSLTYHIPKNWFEYPVMGFFYIPFETLWHASGNKEGKNPNDYYLFEVSTSAKYRKKACWGIHLEYENKGRRWRRKQLVMQSPKFLAVPQKDDAVTTEQLEPLYTSSSHVSAEHNIATDTGLQFSYENKNLEVDQEITAVQREMGNASRKRKRRRKRNRNRKRNETNSSHCPNSKETSSFAS